MPFFQSWSGFDAIPFSFCTFHSNGRIPQTWTAHQAPDTGNLLFQQLALSTELDSTERNVEANGDRKGLLETVFAQLIVKTSPANLE